MAVVLKVVNEASVALTGVLTFGSAVVTGLSSTAALVVGQLVQGVGVQAGTLVLSIDSTTQVTLSQAMQATGSTALVGRLEPVTLAQAKAQIRLETAADDALVSRLIAAARRTCETHVKRAFLATTFDASWDAFPTGGGYYDRSARQLYASFPGSMGATFPGFLPTYTGFLELPRPDLISITSVTYYDSTGALQTLSPSAYNVQPGVPGRIEPVYGSIWPTTQPRVGALTVRFVAGYGTTLASVPEDVQSAILLMVGHLYENRGEVNVEIPTAVRRLLSSADWGGYG